MTQFSLAGRVGGAIERTVAERFEFAPKQFVIRRELQRLAAQIFDGATTVV